MCRSENIEILKKDNGKTVEKDASVVISDLINELQTFPHTAAQLAKEDDVSATVPLHEGSLEISPVFEVETNLLELAGEDGATDEKSKEVTEAVDVSQMIIDAADSNWKIMTKKSRQAPIKDAMKEQTKIIGGQYQALTGVDEDGISREDAEEKTMEEEVEEVEEDEVEEGEVRLEDVVLKPIRKAIPKHQKLRCRTPKHQTIRAKDLFQGNVHAAAKKVSSRKL